MLKWAVPSFVEGSVSHWNWMWVPQLKDAKDPCLRQTVSAPHNPSIHLFLFFSFSFRVWIPWILYLLFLLSRAKPPMQTSSLDCSCLTLHSRLKAQLSPVHVMLTYDWNIQTWTPGIFHLLFICWAGARSETAARNPAGQVLPVGVTEKQ